MIIYNVIDIILLKKQVLLFWLNSYMCVVSHAYLNAETDSRNSSSYVFYNFGDNYIP